MTDKYTEAEETIEIIAGAVNEQVVKLSIGFAEAAQVNTLLVVAEMMVDVARTLAALRREGVLVQYDEVVEVRIVGPDLENLLRDRRI